MLRRELNHLAGRNTKPNRGFVLGLIPLQPRKFQFAAATFRPLIQLA
jgi:hypothetical protein